MPGFFIRSGPSFLGPPPAGSVYYIEPDVYDETGVTLLNKEGLYCRRHFTRGPYACSKRTSPRVSP